MTPRRALLFLLMGAATLAWDYAGPIKYFRVYEDAGTSATIIGRPTALTFTTKKFKGTKRFFVTAFDGVRESQPSNTVTAKR